MATQAEHLYYVGKVQVNISHTLWQYYYHSISDTQGQGQGYFTPYECDTEGQGQGYFTLYECDTEGQGQCYFTLYE